MRNIVKIFWKNIAWVENVPVACEERNSNEKFKACQEDNIMYEV